MSRSGGSKQHTPTPSRSGRSPPTTSAAAAAAQALHGATPARSRTPSAGGEEDAEPPPMSESLQVVSRGCAVFKVPTGTFASVERKQFFLLTVLSPKAQELLASARKEMKGKAAKEAYYASINSGVLLHWESSKAVVHDTFVWLSPRAPRTEWSVHWGQSAGQFKEKKLKSDLSSASSVKRSFTIQTPKRTLDLIVDSREDFKHWKNVIASIDAQR